MGVKAMSQSNDIRREDQRKGQNESNGNNVSQLIKAKQPPVWADGQDFEKYSDEVRAWDSKNKAYAFSKYMDVIESLKKNSKIDKFVMNVVMNKTSLEANKTVE